MGLDIVEVVLRCEEAFNVQLENLQLQGALTVGILFELICEQLHLLARSDAPTPADWSIPQLTAPREGWTRDTVWSKVVQICSHQLQINPEEVTYSASFVDDLRVD